MQIVTDDNKRWEVGPSVATIGCFDGVHRGHRFLINQVVEEAESRGMYSMLITFPVHPRQVMQQDYQPELLSCLQQRESLLMSQRADYCLFLPFTKELSLYSAREFMQFLRDCYQVYVLVIGYDHRFGHNRSEGFTDYCRYAQELGMEVVLAKGLTEEGVSISSSVIRGLLKQGKLEQANHYLGYRYYLDGKVVDGYKMGRKLGFPTANLQPSCVNKLIPADGVYAAYVYLENKRHMAMLNIGHRPTVDNGQNQSIEAHILDYSGDIYYHSIRIELVCFVRSEKKFDSLDSLVIQLGKDKQTVKELLSLKQIEE